MKRKILVSFVLWMVFVSGIIVSRGTILNGPINDVSRQNDEGIKPMLIIYGTQNPDPTGTESDKQTAYRFRDLCKDRGSDVNVKADKEVTEADIEKYNLVLYGGPVSNSIVAEINNELPIKFEKINGEWNIVAGRNKFTGDDVGLIMACPNPLYPSNYVLIYAGLTRDGTEKANSVYHGPTDYLIFNNTSLENFGMGVVLMEGFLDKSDSCHWKLSLMDNLFLTPDDLPSGWSIDYNKEASRSWVEDWNKKKGSSIGLVTTRTHWIHIKTDETTIYLNYIECETRDMAHEFALSCENSGWACKRGFYYKNIAVEIIDAGGLEDKEYPCGNYDDMAYELLKKKR